MQIFRTIIDDREVIFKVNQIADALHGEPLGYYVEYMLDERQYFTQSYLRKEDGHGVRLFNTVDQARQEAPALIKTQFAAR